MLPIVNHIKTLDFIGVLRVESVNTLTCYL
nr:MAG TPA: hypothetical protein [Caudoviricetes sp.]DAJ03410.1 MAG TPA: hypothetical protein [Caudoviricetes sp.]DAW91854.1 MAG TPA: hypothetical protein [Bacteriophage sp.]DAZ13028.1 MAG TPA: hypothetical protein [Caudoviricetes sp.]